MRRILGLSLAFLAFSCSAASNSFEGLQSAPDVAPSSSNTSSRREAASKGREEKQSSTEPYETVRAPSLPAPDQWKLTATYEDNRNSAPQNLGALRATLRPAAQPHQPTSRVESARHYDLLQKRLRLTPAQTQKLAQSGFVSLAMDDSSRKYGMAGLYLRIWQAELPVLVTTDSILHAWHRSYDHSLMQFEVKEAMPAYRQFLEGMRDSLKQTHATLPKTLAESAHDLDIYLAVALSLLGPELSDRQRYEIHRGQEKAPDPVVTPIIAPKKQVAALLRAIKTEAAQNVWIHGSTVYVDFSQFKVRGHYNKSEALKKYFQAALWMGRADTGFTLVDSRRKVHPRGARTALLAAHLARHSGQREAFAKVQKSIDYFVGSANGLSIGHIIDFLDEEGITDPTALAADAKVEELAVRLAQRGPSDRVTSQGIVSNTKEPPPLTFQLASQRFTLDSFVHDQLSSDEVANRHMVTAPEVFAAFGSDEATRLLEPAIERYKMSDEFGALRKTVHDLPQSYWEQNVYTRWFDALRTLDEVPDNQYFPSLFYGRGWQRKQLQTQLASFAELRRDTILYVAQSYSSILCDFPDMYVEPYPEFFGKMEQMARDASQHLNNGKFFTTFADIMARLERTAQAQLDGQDISKEDQAFLYHLVKRNVSSGGCGPPTISWSGWYRQLFSDGEVDLWEPVIADVFTDPNTGNVLNVATASPELAIISIETKKGPGIFVGPIYAYREFIGARMNDQEWQKALRAGKAPPAPSWTSDFQAGKASPPVPHEMRRTDPGQQQSFY